MVPVLRMVSSSLLIALELLISAMTPAFLIAAINDDIVPVLVIVVMLLPALALKINSAGPRLPLSEIVPLLVMVVIVPLFSRMGDPLGLESVIPAPTVKLSRVHPLFRKLTLVLEFTAYGSGDRHDGAAADK